jgi:hypothetical protein
VPELAPEHATRRATMDDVALSSVQELHFGHAKARYSLNFFGDVSFSVFSPAGPERQPSFALGAQDFLLRGELGGHLIATTEFAVEFAEDGTAGLDLERLHIRWQEQHFFVEAGRWHTDFGYWNDAYHHGRWLQPTIARPRWVRFEDEGGLLPVHWVGLSGGASTDLGPGKLRATLSVGNGRGRVVDDVRNTADYSGRKSLQANAEYIGLGLPDLRVGISGIYGRIPAQAMDVRPALPGQPIDEWIGSVHVAYPSTPLLLIAEGYLIEHRANGQSWRTYGGFALIGYSLEIVTPYLELSQILSAGGADPFFIPDRGFIDEAPALDAFDFIAGARLDLSEWSALKLEYQYSQLRPQGITESVVLNCSWGF